MPKVRHAHHRYEILDELLRRSYSSPMTLNEMTEELNLALERKLQEGENFEPIKSRTVRQDFQVMRRNFQVDIQVKRRHEQPAFYMYDSGFRSIHHGGLSQSEADDVRDMLKMLTRFLSHEQFQFLHPGIHGTSPLGSLFRMFLTKEDPKLDRFLDGTTAILFDSVIQDYEGATHIDSLAGAIQDQRIISVHYKSFKGSARNFDFHPYVLKQYNNRWYCFGFDPVSFADGHGPHRNIALDRINGIDFLSESDLKQRKEQNPLHATFRSSPIKDWEAEVFSCVVGVSIDNSLWMSDGRLPKPPVVELAFHPDQLKYEETKPIHHSRRPSKTNFANLPEGWGVISYRLFPNREFEQQILMRGRKVMVMSPPELVAKIRSEQRATEEAYQRLFGNKALSST